MTKIDTAEFIPEIVDQFAHIKPLSAFDPADLERMSPTRKTLFMGAHKALTESAEVEQAAKDGDQQVRDAIVTLSDLRAAIEALRPPWTPMDEYRRVVKHIEPPEPTAEAKEAAALAQAEYDTAAAELARLQEHVRMVHEAVVPARKFAGEAWARYHDIFRPPSPEALIRQHLAAVQQRRRDGTDQPKPVARVIQSPIDAPRDLRSKAMSSRGHYPRSMLNQTVAKPKEAPWSAKPMGPRQ